MRQVVCNSQAMCDKFLMMGYDVLTSGTDNHLFVLDLRNKFPEMTGAQAQELLDRHNITVNKNCVVNESRSPAETSGIRIGTAAMTAKGWKEIDFVNCAIKINAILMSEQI